MRVSIAGFNIEFNNKFTYFSEFSKGYETINNCDINFSISDSEIENERTNNEEPYTPAYLETIALFRKLAEWLPHYEAFVLHSACFDVDGEGVAFAAHSGTGKTTHMMLWQKMLCKRMKIVNGDKPVIRFWNDDNKMPYAYGTPWNGNERLGCNMRTPLKHICFIERSETNYVEPMNKTEAIDRIFNQVYMPRDPVAVINTMQLIDRLLSCCKLWTIHCNMNPEAAEIAYKTIFEK